MYSWAYNVWLILAIYHKKYACLQPYTFCMYSTPLNFAILVFSNRYPRIAICNMTILVKLLKFCEWSRDNEYISALGFLGGRGLWHRRLLQRGWPMSIQLSQPTLSHYPYTPGKHWSKDKCSINIHTVMCYLCIIIIMYLYNECPMNINALKSIVLHNGNWNEMK